MNRDRMLLGIGGALMVAILASSYVYRKLKETESGAKAAAQVQVAVAAGPVKLGQRLTADDVALVSWPAGMQPAGSFARKEDCGGRAVIVPLVKNEVILDQELAKSGEGAGLPVAIPPGMRAVSVGVDDVVAVAGFVTPGTLVDVLVTGAGQNGPMTRTILEHTRVLAVGQQVQTENGKPQSAPVVTLLVSPEAAEKLTLAAADGRIHLALRNTMDMADVGPAPVYGYNIFLGEAPSATARQVATGKSTPRATKPAHPEPFTMQVIRGDKVNVQSFPR